MAAEAVEFAKFTLDVFDNIVLKNSDYVNLILSDAFTHRTHYMGMVDEHNHVNFYDGGSARGIARRQGMGEIRRGSVSRLHGEHVEPWSYMKFCYLKPGLEGLHRGRRQRRLQRGPAGAAERGRRHGHAAGAGGLSRSTSRRLGGKPVHQTLANHWARVVELLYAAERMKELADDPEITDPDIRATCPRQCPAKASAWWKRRAARCSIIIRPTKGPGPKANLIVATQNNAARIAMSVEKAAKGLVSRDNISEGVLNMVEMAFRAYDPCHGCATHSLPGDMPLMVRVRDRQGEIVGTLQRDGDGQIHKNIT